MKKGSTLGRQSAVATKNGLYRTLVSSLTGASESSCLLDRVALQGLYHNHSIACRGGMGHQVRPSPPQPLNKNYFENKSLRSLSCKFSQEPVNALFLMGCFPVDFQEVKRPLRTKSVKRPIKVGKRPINEGKRPIKAMVLVGISVSCLMGCFRAPPPWRKTAPLKRPIKRSMIFNGFPREIRNCENRIFCKE